MNVFEEKSFKGKEALVAVALDQFSNKGYVDASINDMLGAANVSKGSFYYHFKNKEDLYMYLISLLIEKKRDYFSNAVPQEAYSDNDFFTLLELLIKTGIEFAHDHPEISKFSERFMKEQGTDIYNKALSKYNFQDNASFEMLIKNAMDKDAFRDGFDEKFIVAIISYLFTHIAEILRPMDLHEFENGFEYFIEFLKHGLQKEQ